MNFETAEVSLIGNREENQDRCCVLMSDTEILLVVADGMGGHHDGEAAAAAAVDTFSAAFKEEQPSAEESEKFLQQHVEKAHRSVLKLGKKKPIDTRPRTTIVASIIIDGIAHWAHVGDSRLYVFRKNALHLRTRDHSAVETMFQRGQISETEMLTHPSRHLVEECLGGDPETPETSIGDSFEMQVGDVLLLCSDGFWTPHNLTDIAKKLCSDEPLEDVLEALAVEAVESSSPNSDNATATALRWLGEDEE